MSYKSHELSRCHFVLLIYAFFSAAYDEPYLLALLTDCIEIRTVEPCLFIQSVTVPKPRLVVRCRQGLVYVASVGHVWCLQAVPFARQIHVLLEDKQFQLALKLTVCIMLVIRLCIWCQIHFCSQFYVVPTIYSPHFKYAQTSGHTKYRELVCFTRENNSSWTHHEHYLLLTECPNDAQFYAMCFSTALLIHAQSSSTLWTYIAPKEKTVCS
jgi:hypothetical protein